MSGRKARELRGLYKFDTLAGFIEGAIERKMPRADVEQIIDNLRMGLGLQKRDRELARFMEQAPPSFEDDPVWLKGFEAGYGQARADLKSGMDILEEAPAAPEQVPS
jgi:hypothetical protein